MSERRGDAPGSKGRTLSLWPLPLAAGLLPLVATLIAFQLSAQLGLIPCCNPFFEGCVSISRAARQDAPNVIFRALVMPAALLQAACWWLCPAWLGSLRAAPDRRLAALPWLGIIAGACMLLYVTALGVDGTWYRFMRRYGVIFYFGLTCINMLIVSGRMRRLGADRPRRRGAAPEAPVPLLAADAKRPGGRSRGATRALLVSCAALPLLGLVHVFGVLAIDTQAARDALENVTEWWAGAIFTFFFFALAWAWRASGYRARLQSHR